MVQPTESMSRLRNLINSREERQRDVWSNELPSSQESSETEFVEEEKPWPPVSHQSRSKTLLRQVTRRVVRPQSNLFRRGSGEGKERRSKHSRRWENSAFLNSLHAVPEDECVTTPLPDHHSPFTRLHSSEKHMQIWTSFSSRSEEEQRLILEQQKSGRCEAGVGCEYGVRGGESVGGRSAEERFHRIDRRIRSFLQYSRYIPFELLSSLEEELDFLFGVCPGAVVLCTLPHSYSRLILHGLCQFMALHSTTVECDGVSVVTVTCKSLVYHPPSCRLSDYLRTR